MNIRLTITTHWSEQITNTHTHTHTQTHTDTCESKDESVYPFGTMTIAQGCVCHNLFDVGIQHSRFSKPTHQEQSLAIQCLWLQQQPLDVVANMRQRSLEHFFDKLGSQCQSASTILQKRITIQALGGTSSTTGVTEAISQANNLHTHTHTHKHTHAQKNNKCTHLASAGSGKVVEI